MSCYRIRVALNGYFEADYRKQYYSWLVIEGEEHP